MTNGVRIHPTAEVSPQANIGDGTKIWHQVHIREGANIGKNCILGKGTYVDFEVTIGNNCKLQNGAMVYHPAVLDDGVFLGPGAIIANDKYPRAVNPDMTLKSADDWEVSAVKIGKGAAIGAGSIVLPGVEIGAWALVGSGSVVTKDVAEHEMVVGHPARLVGYACFCGRRLDEISEGNFDCGHCGQQLKLSGEPS